MYKHNSSGDVYLVQCRCDLDDDIALDIFIDYVLWFISLHKNINL